MSAVQAYWEGIRPQSAVEIPDYVKDLERSAQYSADLLAQAVGFGAGELPPFLAQKVAESYITQTVQRLARRQIDAEGRQPLMALTEAEVSHRPAPEFLVDGMMPVVGIGSMFGQSGAYKSFLALDLMLCVNSGAAFLGRPVKITGNCLYIMGEGQYDAGQRLGAALAAHPEPRYGRIGYIEQGFPLSDGQSVAEAIGIGRQIGDVRLVVFDSLADFYGAEDNESASGDMQRIVRGMKQISEALGCAVMANAHSGHDQADADGNLTSGDRMRGSSRFRQAWDFEWRATGRQITCTKNRYGPKFPPVPYALIRSGESLAISTSPMGAAPAEEPEWPHPVTASQLDRVVDAVWRTPGQSMSVIARAASVRKDVTPVALARAAEVGLIFNSGTASAQKWSPNPAVESWLKSPSDAPILPRQAGR